MLVREPGPRYEIHGTIGSFHKFGMDVQEDHLKAGFIPLAEHFGVEPTQNNGKMNATLNGISMDATVKTHAGNWKLLYYNLADAIRNGKDLLIKKEEILTLMEILENVKVTS